MILTQSEIKAYIPTNTLTVTYLAEHEKRAMLKHLPKYLGITQTKLLLSNPLSAKSLLLIEQLKGAIANFAILEATPFIDVVPTNTGFGIVSTQNIAPASAARVDAFKNAALKAAEDYLGDALLFLEENIIDYPAWNSCSLFTGGLIESIEQWPSEIDINNSRIRFVNLIQFLRIAQQNWLSKKISQQFVATLVGSSDLTILPDIRKSLAFKALYLQMCQQDNLNKTNYNELAIDYLNSALNYLNNNLTQYPIYEQYGYEPKFTNDIDNYGFMVMG